MVAVGPRAVRVAELQEKVLAILSPDRRVRETSWLNSYSGFFA